MNNVLVTGNADFGIAKELKKIYPDAMFVSRSNEYDLTEQEGLDKVARLARHSDLIIICSALWRFQQTVVLDVIYKACLEYKNPAHIITIGSTTDRVNRGNTWLYNAEKKALRDFSNSCGIAGVWSEAKPKVSYVSFGTLSNNQHKHPDRKCMPIEDAAAYIKWVADAPRNVCINEISIDPMQGAIWHE